MPLRLRDSLPAGPGDPAKKDSTKLDKSERRSRHRSHRKSSSKDQDPKSEKRTSSPSDSKRRSSMPDIQETGGNSLSSNGLESRSSLPYPSFSKAHSKEAVGTRDNSRPALNIFTPEPTDVNASKTKLPSPEKAPPRNAPPSPPLTQVDQNVGQRRGSNAKPAEVETILEEDVENRGDNDFNLAGRSKPSRSNGRVRSGSAIGSDLDTKNHLRSKDIPMVRPKVDQDSKLQRPTSQPTRTISPASTFASTENATNISSQATSIAPDQPTIQRPGSKVLHVRGEENLAPEVRSLSFGGPPREQTPLEVVVEDDRASGISPVGVNGNGAPPPPPPPPPPLSLPISTPKVDYLLHNGGLSQPVPRTFLLAGKPMVIQQSHISPQQNQMVLANLFEPYNQLLDDFTKVVSKNGSLAVATGYRSVARRLLDRLEAVFARDISSESCECCICQKNDRQSEDARGVSWGEVLELVSGRRDLPSWPPFTFVASPVGIGISLEAHVPMQKLDVDVPEEFRDHYIRQSRKTKQSVDKWLNRQNQNPSSPPEEVDDETLTFAILTHLNPELRPDFSNLLELLNGPLQPAPRKQSPDRGPTPQPSPAPQVKDRPEVIVKAGEAIQRLYRLNKLPRDPETALFMVNHPNLHNALATLAAVSDHEWDILISGRFDGFLRSGAEDMPDPNNMQARNTPFRGTPALRSASNFQTNGNGRQGSHPSRAPTPATVAQYGAPIAFDEETEIATLAEIEREIYSGMEALEDAFEALHVKAEMVRNALRARSAGLAATAQRRRGGSEDNIEVRTGTPFSGLGPDKWDSESDNGFGDWDGISELAPDDSASNISSSRRRRPKRRHDRRTPALLEEDEDEPESEGTASPRKR